MIFVASVFGSGIVFIVDASIVGVFGNMVVVVGGVRFLLVKGERQRQGVKHDRTTASSHCRGETMRDEKHLNTEATHRLLWRKAHTEAPEPEGAVFVHSMI